MNEILLTAAKLAEQKHGRIDTHHEFVDSVGLTADPDHRSNLAFVDANVEEYNDSKLFEIVTQTFTSDLASEALHNGDSVVMSYLTGVTSQDLDASSLTLPIQLLEALKNNNGLATILAAGHPNTGKTNTVWILTELAKAHWPNMNVISNAKASHVDIRVTSSYDLAVALLKHRDEPSFVVIDEGSTHFNARTNSRQVSHQWGPLHARFSKLGVEACAVIGHTGKDVDPEIKRLCTLGLYKTEPAVAEFYDRWSADSDRPTDQLFGGDLEPIQPTTVDYDPDEPAPWSWNLNADLFSNDLGWDDLLEELQSQGPS